MKSRGAARERKGGDREERRLKDLVAFCQKATMEFPPSLVLFLNMTEIQTESERQIQESEGRCC